ncbi:MULTISPECIES: glutamine--fructose-6-phosphate transaminase (isomerizing) [unclassified Granulicatella]|uniref:glutamine--fructose-6-phosphate transaminase (isomerizing) n=1 Tax=unclassified Granulicatella TaxID=2630493 RepID=UPI0010738EE6|nr:MULTISPECIES: glutamine--fructose-6-phosphate transaminase (isomerizing) [unclassified Granulicatella]MBF0781017.1 glutamine--fructose-6-phosphate transaminase (isomerizing) [Granulicatella sp. 19428wC4_WM01]TFU92589.1 glutamine--fructose-6-phosphate transaminase (isomerizing) [Granulicatella sp. WM01]
MCGIVGYIGNEQAQPILLTGLEKLEYRGYDSAGIYVVEHQKGYLFKEVGRIQQLKEATDYSICATYGIGHTRWATHGVPSTQNAHPHQSFDKRFTLVHNGVIENYQELKETYLSHVVLQGQTDTEVIVSLIAYFAQEKQWSAKQSFQYVLSLIHGSYAFALIDNQTPDVIYAAKHKSPLLVGIGSQFNMVCSDAMAGIHQTRQFIELHDGEFVTLTKADVSIEKDGHIIQRQSYTAQIDASDLEKGTYPFYMLKEIDEQPAVLRRIIKEYTKDNQLDIPNDVKQAILTSDRIHIIACGTSYHAGLVGKYYLETFAHIPTEVHIASEFSYHPPLISGKPFFIFISQSGETADSRQALVKINEWNYPSLTLTNVNGSTLSRESNYTLLLHAGPEIAVASTKAYIAQMAVLSIIAYALSHDTLKDAFNLSYELSLVSNAMESIISQKDDIHIFAKTYLKDAKHAFFIGRGLDYLVSLEAALKLKEISYIQTEGFAAGELKHGTIALIEQNTPVFTIITQDETSLNTRGNIQEVKARGAKTCTFVMGKLATKDDQFILPDVSKYLSPLLSIVPSQLLAYYATLELGYDVDKPRNLAKSVTVE